MLFPRHQNAAPDLRPEQAPENRKRSGWNFRENVMTHKSHLRGSVELNALNAFSGCNPQRVYQFNPIVDHSDQTGREGVEEVSKHL